MAESDRYEIYRNPNAGKYKFTVFRPYATNAVNLEREIISNGTKKRVIVTGVPDGVSEHTNLALVDRDTPRRLVVSFDVPLSESELSLIDDAYKTLPYPVPTFQQSIGAILNDKPNVNFIMPTSQFPPTSLSRYTEYRYFKMRHIPATIMFDQYNKMVHRFVPPTTNVTIIMPENFVKTSINSGFFVAEENLIIRIYSRRPLSAAITQPDHNLYSEISIHDSKILDLCKRILMNLGFHKIAYQSDNQIYGVDSLVTSVIGNTANINLPKYV